tara:strand:- start:136 stop:387 length:252 start_codon:yes stop_codon:yes gene_type:complete
MQEEITAKKDVKTLNVRVANLPLFDENGKMLPENFPVSTIKCETREYTVIKDEPRAAATGISELMASDTVEMVETTAAYSQGA